MRNDVSALIILYLRTTGILATTSTNFTPGKIWTSAPFITIFSQGTIGADTPKAVVDSSQSAWMFFDVPSQMINSAPRALMTR